MKTIITMLLGAFLLTPFSKASAQKEEIAQLVLNIQKLNQLRQVLTQIKKTYEILEGGYNTIIGISKGNFNIHKTHLDGLLNVSPTVRNYQRVGSIIQYQYYLVNEYTRAQRRFNSSGNYTSQELTYIAGVYGNLLNQSLRNLDELTTVLTAGETRMSDDERLKIIDRIYFEMQDKLNFLRQFNSSTQILGLNRMKEKNDAKHLQHLYGVQN
ncbi:MAG: TerB family tellurite resistance protein [Crocinitomicaceae bacterium]|nr:TerB family tellurite resistance protein [Crocinitomicaceae bacterium]